MNAQLKLLLYIAMICLIFYFVQDRFDIFDIEFISDSEKNTEEENSDIEEEEFFIQEGELTIIREDESAVVVNIEIADTEEEREKGLMDINDLGDYNGMLFVFEEEGRNSFWMKNTEIALDLIFINSSKEVVEIIQNAQPCAEGHICPKLTPNIEYMYCLEVNSGFVAENRVDVGNIISWKND